jgi:hypothetical protein
VSGFRVHVPHCTPHWRGLCRPGARPVWRNKNKKSPRPQACRIDYARTHKWRLRLRADAGCLQHCSEWNQPRAPTKDASDPDQTPAVPATASRAGAPEHFLTCRRLASTLTCSAHERAYACEQKMHARDRAQPQACSAHALRGCIASACIPPVTLLARSPHELHGKKFP